MRYTYILGLMNTLLPLPREPGLKLINFMMVVVVIVVVPVVVALDGDGTVLTCATF